MIKKIIKNSAKTVVEPPRRSFAGKEALAQEELCCQSLPVSLTENFLLVRRNGVSKSCSLAKRLDFVSGRT